MASIYLSIYVYIDRKFLKKVGLLITGNKPKKAHKPLNFEVLSLRVVWLQSLQELLQRAKDLQTRATPGSHKVWGV